MRVAQGDLPGALAAYEESLAIARDLAARDKGNAGWPRDVSVSLNKLGDVRVAQGDLSGALAAYEESLASPATSPPATRATPAGTRRLGQPEQGRRRARRPGRPRRRARSLRGEPRHPATSPPRDPGNAGWARDVSVSLNKVGDVRVAQGDLAGALAAYEESLGIRRDLAARDKGNAGWARDVWVSCWKLATTDTANAAAHWAEVVTRMEDMAARGILLPTDAAYLDQARANLAAARARRD